MVTRIKGKVEKGWGFEDIWVSNDHYCSKFMEFKTGSKFSMHFHKEKIETWYVMTGEFLVHWINTKDATKDSVALKAGDVWHNDALFPHQVECIQAGVILEVSTPDSVEDNYRVLPGDSQAKS
jgi:mannose-6-phosphate isomerase-like protein (cupin superfamily)